MAAFVQGVTGNTAATPTTGTFGSTTTSGNLIVVTTADDSGDVTNGIAVSDNKGNTYTKINHFAGVSTISNWYAYNITGGASHQISVAWSEAATGRVTFVAQEFSGILTTDPFENAEAVPEWIAQPTTNSSACAKAAVAPELGAVLV